MMFSKPQDLKTDSPGEIFILSRNNHFKVVGSEHDANQKTNEGEKWRIFRDQNHECWYCQNHSLSIVCFEQSDPSLRQVELSKATLRHLDFSESYDNP